MPREAATPEQTRLPIPSDRYEVIDRIGTGMALFKARAYDRETEQQVFLKAEDPEDEHAVLRLMREADTYESLEHPRIPRLLDADRSDDVAYIATDFMPGSRSLPQRLKMKGPKPLTVAKLCVSALEVLEYVHGKGLVHRDVKTSNFLMRTAGEASLSDFGIARRVGGAELTEDIIGDDTYRRVADTAITHTGDFAGTPAYSAPEQLLGVSVSAQSDIYGVGSMLHEMLDGRLPFLKSGETTASNNELASRKFLPHEGHFWQNGRPIPPALKLIVLKALEPNLANRYASAGEMAEDLERYLSDPRPASAPRRLVRRSPESATYDTATPPTRRMGTLVIAKAR